MAVVLIKTQDNFLRKKIFMYGIIPLLVLFLFYSLHIAMLNAESSAVSDTSVGSDMEIIVTTSKFSGTIVVTGNEDMSGSIVIPAGANGVDTVFDGGFTNIPSIVLEVEGAHDIDRYYVENVTSNGFTILIDPIQTTQTIFTYGVMVNKKDIVSITENSSFDFSVTVDGNRTEVLKIATGN